MLNHATEEKYLKSNQECTSSVLLAEKCTYPQETDHQAAHLHKAGLHD